ncbi:MAG: hypothetical protein ETSY1_28140 [Candidatus Entotheonella factor]|uniref:Uncharacterized protein n=1 Tax=Entotheonella factor TaxID=1429438 RepID=W4LDH7_ENTF1|nr:MAG: hypothetical protein ETSY1_28140 [Candidatus Entotheonella factor]
MNVQTKPLSDITEQALVLLTKELGIADTVRFLNQFSVGYGDYTKERDALFADLTLDQILSEIKSQRDSGKT